MRHQKNSLENPFSATTLKLFLNENNFFSNIYGTGKQRVISYFDKSLTQLIRPTHCGVHPMVVGLPSCNIQHFVATSYGMLAEIECVKQGL